MSTQNEQIKEKAAFRRVTLMDVARESGFSTSTVSIVLNEAPLSRYVAATTKQHIRETATSMGYRPDVFARSLRQRRSHTIGVMVFDLADPFCTVILNGIGQALSATGYLPIIMDAHNDSKQFERYLEMLLERRVEGLVVVANWLFADISVLPDFGRNRVPSVIVGRDLSSASIRSVLVDNEAGGYTAVKHLHELGHRSIAYIKGPHQLDDSERRWHGILRFAAEADMVIDPELVGQLPDAVDPISGFDGGYRLTMEWIESGRYFTGMVTFDDLTALGSMRALYEKGLRVPDDCSVIGFDDVAPAALSSPGVTTIRQPMEEMGKLAVSWILQSISSARSGDVELAEANAPMLRLMDAALVRRGSTARPRPSINSLDIR